MIQLAAVVLAIFASAPLSRAQNLTYCSPPYQPDLCKSNNHVACLTYFNTVKNCSADAKVVDLTPLKAWIVAQHNTFRNTLASGTLKNNAGQAFSPAARLPTLQWNDQLAYFAQSNCNTCKYGHSKCRLTNYYQWAGENVAWSSGYSNNTKAIEVLMSSWWDEYKLASMADINAYKSTTATIGHFTVIAQDKSDQIGCGCITYNTNQLFLTCVYAYTNVVGEKVYVSSSTPGSSCNSKSTTYPNLCAVGEPTSPWP